MVVPVVMYGCESWTMKKAGCWRTDDFELWCWRRLLRVPWTARRYNLSILREISPEYSLEGLMLKLKLQNFGHLMRRVDSLEKTLMLGGTGCRRRRGQQRMRWQFESRFHHFYLFLFYLFIFWLYHAACGMLFLLPQIEPLPPALNTWILNHWTIRKVPGVTTFETLELEQGL